MAENKKSFVLYSDLIHTVEKLPDKDAGELFKHLLRYVNDQNPETDNLLVDAIFQHIKQQLKRDLVKYEERGDRSRENGKLGGRPKNPEKPKETQRTQQVNLEPRKPDSVNVSVNDNVTDSVSDINTTHTQFLAEKNLGKDKYGEFVHLSFIEHGKLLSDYGEGKLSTLIEQLNNKIGSISASEVEKNYANHFYKIKQFASFSREDIKPKVLKFT